jgi:DNA-directed RNA polymerase subunit M/transcription elongation factor TFIIS
MKCPECNNDMEVEENEDTDKLSYFCEVCGYVEEFE